MEEILTNILRFTKGLVSSRKEHKYRTRNIDEKNLQEFRYLGNRTRTERKSLKDVKQSIEQQKRFLNIKISTD